MMETTFAVAFFRIYDRKIASGEITFSQTGMKKEDFTRLCTDKTYVFSREEILRLSKTMALTEEEEASLLAFAE